MPQGNDRVPQHPAITCPPIQRTLLCWLPVTLGFFLLYLPVYTELAGTLWRSEEYAHAPLVGLIAIWLAYERLRDDTPSGRPHILGGILLLLCSLPIAFAGRILSLPMLAMVAQPILLAGILLIMSGGRYLRLLWFPLVFLAFMIPLPAYMLEALTGWLKMMISESVEELLYLAGFPVSRQGVVILIGQYRLFIADACSGLHSMLALHALGSLYVYRVADGCWRRKAAMLLLILPLAVLANGLRVLMVVLCTYWFGDISTREWHVVFGLMVFAVTLGLLSILNRLLFRSSSSGNVNVTQA